MRDKYVVRYSYTTQEGASGSGELCVDVLGGGEDIASRKAKREIRKFLFEEGHVLSSLRVQRPELLEDVGASL